jgi:hypothetical protein
MGMKTSRWLKRTGLTPMLLSLTVAGASLAACSGGVDTNPFPTTTSSGSSSAGVGGSGTGGNDTTSATTGTGGTGGVPVVPIQPAAGGARRLIGRQYLGSIRTLLGDNAAKAATPPSDPQLNGFETIGASDLATPPSSV